MIHSHQANERESTLNWVRKAETQSCHKPHPWHSNPQLGGNSKPRASLKEWRICTPHQEPQILRLALEKWAPKHLALKTNGSHNQGTHGSVVSWEMALKGLACRLPAPGLSTETTLGKECMWPKNYCWFYSIGLKDKGLLRYSLGMKAGGCHLPALPLLC